MDVNKGPTIAGIAVDNSSSSPSFGDLYVYDSNLKGQVIKKYSVEGAVTKQIAALELPTGGEKVHLHGIATDASGRLWVYEGNSIDGFGNAVSNTLASQEEITTECEVLASFAGFAVSPSGETFYVGRARENEVTETCEKSQDVIYQVNSKGEPVETAAGSFQLDSEVATGAAVDPADGEVFVNHGTAVAGFTPQGTFTGRFGEGAGEGKLVAGVGGTVDGARNAVYVPDTGAGSVEVYVPAEEAAPGPVAGETLRTAAAGRWSRRWPSWARSCSRSHGSSGCSRPPKTANRSRSPRRARSSAPGGQPQPRTGAEPRKAGQFRMGSRRPRDAAR